MRFKRVELSPANKRQYLIALGRVDIELLLGEAINAKKHTPDTADFAETHSRLASIVKGLKQALVAAQADNDEGYYVHSADRNKYKHDSETNPLIDITRFEIVDHSKSLYDEKGNALEGKGRTVIFWDENKKIESSIQDGGRTLKVFIADREQENV